MAETPESVPSPAQPTPDRRGRLLIVDDEDGPRVSLQFMFAKDYDVLMAADGPSAIQLAESKRVDVAICDIKMQGMSGIEVLQRLKFIDPRIEVVMMTAYETTETLRKALSLRACDYINKPFELEQMRRIVAEAMQRRRERLATPEPQVVQSLTAELQKHKVEHQIAQTRGDIYASVIHDINGPLTVISGFLQMISQRLGAAEMPSAKDLEFTRDKLKVLTRQVNNCIEISRRYLSFLRKQSAGTPTVGVNQLLEDLEHLLRVHPALLDNQFRIVPLPKDIGVPLNGTDVIQAVLNLAVNGFQASPQPHRVDIHTEVLDSPLDMTAYPDTATTRFVNVEGLENLAPLVKISVSDDGPGIPPEVLPKIFDTFFTTKGPLQGTGLGLNIVLRMVKEAGGALRVVTQPGQGSTFTLYLPAVELATANA